MNDIDEEIIPLIFNELEPFSIPHCKFSEAISLILMSDQSMNIVLQIRHIQAMSMRQFIAHVLLAFQSKFPLVLDDLKGLREKGFYLRHADNSYHALVLTLVDQVIDLEDHVYIDIVSDEVWVKLAMTMSIGKQVSKLLNEVKLERVIAFSQIRVILLRVMLTAWNFAYTHLTHREKPKEKELMKEYTTLHYLLTEFTIRAYSNVEMNFDWDNKERYHNCFSVNITINAQMKAIEEMVVNLLQSEIDGISIEKVKMVWGDFVELKSFDELIMNPKLRTEYIAIKTFIKTHRILDHI